MRFFIGRGLKTALIPIIGGLTVYGGAGGMAPHAVHARLSVHAPEWVTSTAYTIGDVVAVDYGDVYTCTSDHTSGAGTKPGVGGSWPSAWDIESSTSAGWWSEGRYEYAFTKSDGSALDSGDAAWMQVNDPVSGEVAGTAARYSAAPVAAFVFRSPGSYRVAARYQNRDGQWSDWVNSDAIVVASNARTKVFVNGSTGNDGNDGLSSGQAKATLNGALSVVDSDDYEIELADDMSCDCTASVNTGGYSGIWVHRSNTGAARPVVVAKAETLFRLGSDTIIEGIEFEYDGVTERGLLAVETDRTNLTVADCRFNEGVSILEIDTGRDPVGLLLLRLETVERLQRYVLYIDGGEAISILGCNFSKGSLDEHTLRLASATPNAEPTAFVSVEMSTLDHNSANDKSCIRGYVSMLGVYRCVLARGSVSIGNINIDYKTYAHQCYDQCTILFNGTSIGQLSIWEGVTKVVLRACYLLKDMSYEGPVIRIQDSANNGDRGGIDGIRFLQMSIGNYGTGNNSVVIDQRDLSAWVRDAVVRGLVLSHDVADGWSWGTRFKLLSDVVPSATPESELADNWTLEDICIGVPVANEIQTSDGYYALEEANAEAWASGLFTEEHTLDALGLPLGAGTLWKNVAGSNQGPFVSIDGVDVSTPTFVGCHSPAGA